MLLILMLTVFPPVLEFAAADSQKRALIRSAAPDTGHDMPARMERMDQRGTAGLADDPYNPDSVEESAPRLRADKKRSSPAAASDSDASHHGDSDGNDAGENASAQGERSMQPSARKKRRPSAGVRRGEEAEAVRAYVAKQKEYQDQGRLCRGRD